MNMSTKEPDKSRVLSIITIILLIINLGLDVVGIIVTLFLENNYSDFYNLQKRKPALCGLFLYQKSFINLT